MNNELTITQFDRATCKLIAQEAEAALQSVAQKYGLKVKNNNGKYGTGHCTLSIEFACVAENGQVQSKEATDFAKLAFVYGLTAEDLGKQFTSNSRVFRVSGLKPSNPRYPVLATDINTGRVFKFPADRVIEKLHR